MDPFVGQIQEFGFNFAPKGWAKCEGQLLAISSNTALFSLIGTIYGGDGKTTFALPDLRGRTPIGQGDGPGLSDRRIGSKSGSETNTLNITNLPSHNHSATGVMVVAGAGTTADPTNAYLAQASGRVTSGPGAGGGVQVNSYGTPATAQGAANGVQVTIGNNGGNLPVNNMQPYLTTNYCIALYGIYPSRS